MSLRLSVELSSTVENNLYKVVSVHIGRSFSSFVMSPSLYITLINPFFHALCAKGSCMMIIFECVTHKLFCFLVTSF